MVICYTAIEPAEKSCPEPGTFRSRKAQNLEGQRDDSFIHSLVHSFFLSFFPRLPLIQHTVEDRLLCAEHGGSLERPNTALAPGPRAGWRCHRRASASGTHRNTQAHPASAAEPGLDIPSGPLRTSHQCGGLGELVAGWLALVHSWPCAWCPLSCADSIAGFEFPSNHPQPRVPLEVSSVPLSSQISLHDRSGE